MSSKEDIFNNAVAIFGGPDESDLIENADTDTSSQAKWIRTAWPQALDFCAAEVEPREFKEDADLDLTGVDVSYPDYDYVYTRPADCLSIMFQGTTTDMSIEYPYDEVKQYILSNVKNARIKYVTPPDRDDTAYYSAGFANVVSARIAVMICGIWKKELLGYAAQRYSAALSEAHAQDGKSKYVEPTSWWTDNT
jgi:hypothetical protein